MVELNTSMPRSIGLVFLAVACGLALISNGAVAADGDRPAAATVGASLIAGAQGGTGQTEERQTVSSTQWPWSAIGRVNRGTILPGQSGFCTGTVVGPRHVLTAAHCLVNQKTQTLLPVDSIHFVAGYARGTYLAHARAVRVVTAPGLRIKGGDRPVESALDWAILVLDRTMPGPPVPLSATAPVAPGSAPTQLIQAGYRQERSHVLSISRDCRLKAALLDGLLLATNCPIAHGDSGGPMLEMVDGRVSVAAIIIAMVHEVRAAPGKPPILALALPVEAFGDAVRTATATAPPPTDAVPEAPAAGRPEARMSGRKAP